MVNCSDALLPVIFFMGSAETPKQAFMNAFACAVELASVKLKQPFSCADVERMRNAVAQHSGKTYDVGDACQARGAIVAC